MRFAIEKIFLWWLFYSVVGWVWETGLNLVLRKKWVDRGILNGPLCPIYGFGAASVIVLLHDVDNPIALFLSSGMLACTLEYFSSWAIEKLFHIRLWDYTGKPFNINGRIYLNGFLAFGIGAAVVKEYVQPWVSDVLDSWQPLTLDILTIIFTLILVTDISLTLSGLLSFHRGSRTQGAELAAAASDSGVPDHDIRTGLPHHATCARIHVPPRFPHTLARIEGFGRTGGNGFEHVADERAGLSVRAFGRGENLRQRIRPVRGQIGDIRIPRRREDFV